MQSPIVHITNNTRSLVHLPPVQGNRLWLTGPRLIPGLNRVPRAYLEALAAVTATVHDAGGRPVVQEVEVETLNDKGKPVTIREKQPVLRYPGRDALARLTTQRVRLVGARGPFMGTAITVHADGEIDENAPEGPAAPASLPENETHALKLVEATSDREALQRWLSEETRATVSTALRARLSAAGG